MKTIFLLLFLPISSTIALSMVEEPFLNTKKTNMDFLTQYLKSSSEISLRDYLDNSYVEIASDLIYNNLSNKFSEAIFGIINQKHYPVCVLPGSSSIEECPVFEDIGKTLNRNVVLNNNNLQFFDIKQELLIPSFNTNLFAYYFNNQKISLCNNTQEILISSGVYSPFIARVDNQHKFVKSFIVDKYPVTNFNFLQFVKENKEWRRSLVPRVFADTSYLAHWGSDLTLSQFSDKNSPVTRVSWFAANAYCESLGKHLPTIDQWEYIAENKGLNLNLIDDKILNWYLIPNSLSIPRVGNQEKNVYGISDIYASIWEWTEDFNSILIAQDLRANEERKNGPLFCGAGAIGLDPSRYIKFTRYSMRDSLRANYVVTSLGFRCVR